MKLFETDKILEQTSNIIHEDTQLHDRHIDLTVAEIHRLIEAGSLDFGGNEFTIAGTEPIEPEKRNQDDKYAWWDLKIDTYKAVLNETIDIPKNSIAVITPHSHTEKAGLIINTLFLSPKDDLEGLNMYFRVPVAGCKIKENARLATLRCLSK